MADPPSKPFSPSEYDRYLNEVTRESIKRSREVLEQTEPLVRKPAQQKDADGKSPDR